MLSVVTRRLLLLRLSLDSNEYQVYYSLFHYTLLGEFYDVHHVPDVSSMSANLGEYLCHYGMDPHFTFLYRQRHLSRLQEDGLPLLNLPRLTARSVEAFRRAKAPRWCPNPACTLGDRPCLMKKCIVMCVRNWCHRLMMESVMCVRTGMPRNASTCTTISHFWTGIRTCGPVQKRIEPALADCKVSRGFCNKG